jgi:hypothetical protein
MYEVFHEPIGFISIGMGHAAGFTAVPEDRFIRNISAWFIAGMLICCMWSGGSSCARAADVAHKNTADNAALRIGANFQLI